MSTFALTITLCSAVSGECDDYIFDSGLTLADCNRERVQTLIAHARREKDGVMYGSYIKSASCDKE